MHSSSLDRGAAVRKPVRRRPGLRRPGPSPVSITTSSPVDAVQCGRGESSKGGQPRQGHQGSADRDSQRRITRSRAKNLQAPQSSGSVGAGGGDERPPEKPVPQDKPDIPEEEEEEDGDRHEDYVPTFLLKKDGNPVKCSDGRPKIDWEKSHDLLKRMLEEGLDQKSIAKIFNRTPQTINQVINKSPDLRKAFEAQSALVLAQDLPLSSPGEERQVAIVHHVHPPS